MIEGLGSARVKMATKTPKAALKSIRSGTAGLEDVLIVFEDQERKEKQQVKKPKSNLVTPL